MKRAGVTICIPLLAISFCLTASGCSEDEKSTGPVNPYRELTEKEDCIDNLIISHKRRELDEYLKLLHDDYYWYGSKWGLFSDELDILDRAEDIEITEELFQYMLSLDLDIVGGVWEELDEVDGEPCTNCWGTIRYYEFQAQDSRQEMVWISREQIHVIVQPFDDGGTTRYRIRGIHHVRR